jgi:hypothetical protein
VQSTTESTTDSKVYNESEDREGEEKKQLVKTSVAGEAACCRMRKHSVVANAKLKKFERKVLT